MRISEYTSNGIIYHLIKIFRNTKDFEMDIHEKYQCVRGNEYNPDGIRKTGFTFYSNDLPIENKYKIIGVCSEHIDLIPINYLNRLIPEETLFLQIIF